jgi:hypothetical protein
MQPHLELISWRGHRYDARVLGATYEFVALRAQTEAALAAGRDPGAGGLFALETGETVLSQGRDVHAVADTRPEGDICCCSLVVPRGMLLTQATGHLDQRTWDVAEAIVIALETGGRWGALPEECVGYCQDCGWTSATSGPEPARAAARAHRRTGADGRHGA